MSTQMRADWLISGFLTVQELFRGWCYTASVRCRVVIRIEIVRVNSKLVFWKSQWNFHNSARVTKYLKSYLRCSRRSRVKSIDHIMFHLLRASLFFFFYLFLSQIAIFSFSLNFFEKTELAYVWSRTTTRLTKNVRKYLQSPFVGTSPGGCLS